MLAYSGLLTLALLLSAPWWTLRTLTTRRYREGLGQRLGRVPAQLRDRARSMPAGQVIWVHAVSVGEVLAVTRLVLELEAALQASSPATRVVISTTTRTGQTLARERFGGERVFYMPLDFAWPVRRYLRTLRPALLVLLESELWPRMLHECGQAGIPVAVVNARVSDRSFRRGMRLRRVWARVLRQPALWLAQSETDADRLKAMGARAETVQVTGNLKYDIRTPHQSRIVELIRAVAAGRPIVVAGSTVAALRSHQRDEDELVLEAWVRHVRPNCNVLLVLAPRHPERFAAVIASTSRYTVLRATSMLAADSQPAGQAAPRAEIVVLDTIGDLAAVYSAAAVSFVGGSLVRRGGHNPLEPAQFAVPVLMGPSFENFRDIVAEMQAHGGIQLVQDQDALGAALFELLKDPASAARLGQSARRVFIEQQGATRRTVEALVALQARTTQALKVSGESDSSRAPAKPRPSAEITP